MKRGTIAVCLLVAFVAGIGVTALAKKGKKPGVTTAAWDGKSGPEAAEALLDIGTLLAEDGSWERIAVGRVYYLSGKTDAAETIFRPYATATKPNAGDLVRIARVYAEAGDWEKAAPLYDRVLEMKPDDADWLVEYGAHLNLRGDRERAEELFAHAFSLGPRSLRNTLAAAGSYVDVEPRRR